LAGTSTYFIKIFHKQSPTPGFEVISVARDTLLKQIKDDEVQLSTEIDAQLLKYFKNDALGVILKELIHESGYIF